MEKIEQNEDLSKELSPSEYAAKALFDFSIDREDVKFLLSQPPEDHNISKDTMEYELQLLKIISTGWSISFYLGDDPLKMKIAERFWEYVHSFSDTITSTTELTLGKKVDYFNVLRERLSAYLDSLKGISTETDPLSIIGPEFGKFCGDKDDVFTMLTGSKMFAATLNRVKDFLETIVEKDQGKDA
ncbi:MAG: cytoplasmic protein [Candidatus Magnetoglobus multicellularis str. Araruama]|uniref:Cytoplasmic protein n=1 Tax=Candidatus Magnetoglobus multicellularis str. Araruama TaxID=890399 RepID=A0A1V1PE36_9BACT|nr:MAG: cytoplasmic protein [Candidatus Magnetoglobus multicellularis str. Araruama]